MTFTQAQSIEPVSFCFYFKALFWVFSYWISLIQQNKYVLMEREEQEKKRESLLYFDANGDKIRKKERDNEKSF